MYPHLLEALKPAPVELPTLNSEDCCRVISFNICWEDVEENSWHSRKEKIASIIRFHKADLIGLQEPLQYQIEDLKGLLPEYDSYGVGCEDGKDKGVHNAILFRKARYELMEHSFFFLSETPNIPSKGWDAKFYRGVTWAKIYDKKTDKVFFFFNTHFEYHGKEARDNSALLLREQVKKIAKSSPFVITGDFNIFPELGGAEVYNLLTKGHLLIDAQNLTENPHHGPTGTWSGFKEAGQPGIKPDYIFVSPSTKVISHGILCDTFDGQFPSDHLPVVSDLIF